MICRDRRSLNRAKAIWAIKGQLTDEFVKSLEDKKLKGEFVLSIAVKYGCAERTAAEYLKIALFEFDGD